MIKHILQIGMVPKICGGTEVFIMNIFRNINREQIQFDFLVYDSKEKLFFEEEIKRLGGTIHRKYYSALRHPLKRQIALIKLFYEHPEIVGVHFNATALFYIDVLFWAWFFRRPVRIIHSHNTGYDRTKYNFLLNIKNDINKKMVSLFSTDFFACSEAAGRWMFGKRRMFKVVPNAIDLDKYKYNTLARISKRKELSIASNDVCVGFVGRLSYQKNPEFAIELHNSLLTQFHRNIVLLIIGDGEMKDYIESKIDQYDLNESIRLLGNRNDVHELLSAMDVYLFPSRYEGFGLSLLEAEANGLPCLISNNIPKEAVINDNVKIRDLNDDLSLWISDLIDLCEIGRTDNNIEIREKGYDIKDMAKKLSEIYSR